MSSGNRLYKLALGGCLAGTILLGLQSGSLSQEGPPKGRPTIEDSQGVSIDTPGPKPNAQEQSDQAAGEAASTNQPPATIQDEAETQPACDKRCQAAEQREIDDLEAQRSMAASTEDLVGLTFWQAITAGVGLVLLFITLILMIQANKAAIRAAKAAEVAVEVTDDTAKRQLRAYVTLQEARIERKNNQVLKAVVKALNTGQTPALNVDHWITLGNGNGGTFPAAEWAFNRSKADLGAGTPFTLSVQSDPLTDEIWGAFLNRQMPLFVWGEIRYHDIFKKDLRYTCFRLRLREEDDGLSPCSEGNECT